MNMFSFSQANSLGDCVDKCQETDYCISFNYEKEKKSCEMFNQNGTKLQNNNNRMIGYKIKGNPN